MVIILLLNAILVGNVNAIASKVTVTKVGECPDLLKYNGEVIECTRYAYDNGDSLYPAYPLANNTTNDEYQVNVEGYINDPMIWRIISNSFPYNSFQGMGVKNIDEGYLATKEAINCILTGTDENDFAGYEAIGVAGTRTLEAMKNLVKIARENIKETMPSKIIDVISNSENWAIDEKDSNYMAKVYSTSAKAIYYTYQVHIDKTILPEGSKIVNMNNQETDEFMAGENFKILIPVKHKKNSEKFQINVTAFIGTSPVYKATAVGNSITFVLGFHMFEEGTGVLTEEYIKNGSRLTIINKDGITKEWLNNTEFNLLDADKNIKYSNLITNERGEFTITGVEPGKYYLEQTKIKEGYQKLNKLIEIDMQLNKKITANITNNKLGRINVNNNYEDINVTVSGSKNDYVIKDSHQNIKETTSTTKKFIEDIIKKEDNINIKEVVENYNTLNEESKKEVMNLIKTDSDVKQVFENIITNITENKENIDIKDILEIYNTLDEETKKELDELLKNNSDANQSVKNIIKYIFINNVGNTTTNGSTPGTYPWYYPGYIPGGNGNDEDNSGDDSKDDNKKPGNNNIQEENIKYDISAILDALMNNNTLSSILDSISKNMANGGITNNITNNNNMTNNMVNNADNGAGTNLGSNAGKNTNDNTSKNTYGNIGNSSDNSINKDAKTNVVKKLPKTGC